jgi:hypothetical protein
MGQVGDERDAEPLEVACIADAGELEKVRRLDCAGG